MPVPAERWLEHLLTSSQKMALLAPRGGRWWVGGCFYQPVTSLTAGIKATKGFWGAVELENGIPVLGRGGCQGARCHGDPFMPH